MHIFHHCPAGRSVYILCGHCKLKTSKWQNLAHHLSTFDCYTARPCRAKFAFHELPPPVFPLSENPPGHTFSAEPALVANKFALSTITPVDIHESSLPYSSSNTEPSFKVPEVPISTSSEVTMNTTISAPISLSRLPPSFHQFVKKKNLSLLRKQLIGLLFFRP